MQKNLQQPLTAVTQFVAGIYYVAALTGVETGSSIAATPTG
jgi:hypothetical protein